LAFVLFKFGSVVDPERRIGSELEREGIPVAMFELFSLLQLFLMSNRAEVDVQVSRDVGQIKNNIHLHLVG